MLHYTDCGLQNVWLANGYRKEIIEGIGECLEIDDIDGLHRLIGHDLVHYRKRLAGPEIRFIRIEMGLSQVRLAEALGVDEQTISLWERSKRRPTVAAERMLRLMYLEQREGVSKIAEKIAEWNELDRQEDERRVFEESAGTWRLAA